jgi:hypothetical protein
MCCAAVSSLASSPAGSLYELQSSASLSQFPASLDLFVPTHVHTRRHENCYNTCTIAMPRARALPAYALTLFLRSSGQLELSSKESETARHGDERAGPL